MTPTAEQLMQDALEIMKERGATRDKPEGERAMAATVKAFNAITGRNLSETEGWKFMMCLKLGRASSGKFHADDYLDLMGYSSLTAECALREQAQKEIDEKLFSGETMECPCLVGELVDRGLTCGCGRFER